MHILRNASLAAAVVAARADEEKAIKRGEEIMKKAREVLGKEKADEIKQAVAADTVENAMKGVKQSEINGMRGNGLYPVVDVYGHVFYSTVHEINAVETECNNSLFPGKAISRGRTPDYCSDAVYLQDIYELFKNGGSTVYASQHYVDPDDVGEVKFKIGFSSYGDQEEPCITLDYGCEFYPLKSKHGRY